MRRAEGMDSASASEVTGGSKKSWKPRLDTLLLDIAEFCRLLLEHSSNLDQQINTPPSRTFQDEFTASFFPPGAITPFSNFSGTEDRVTVIFTMIETSDKPEIEDSIAATLGDPQESQTNSRLQHERGESTELVVTPPQGPFSITRQSSVNTGQQLTNKRVFLTQSQLLHAGQGSQPTTSTQLFCTQNIGTRATPVPLDKARSLCSLYALGARMCSQHLPSVWVVCQSEGPKKIVALGCSCVNSVLHIYTISEEETVPIPQTTSAGQQKKQSLEKNKRKSLGRPSDWAFSEYEISSATEADKSPAGIVFRLPSTIFITVLTPCPCALRLRPVGVAVCVG